MADKRISDSSAGQQFARQVASTFGVDEEKAQTAVRVLADDLNVRMQRNMLSRGGVADVLGLVTEASDASKLATPEAAEHGNSILNVLIGNKHISRGMAGRAASVAGLDAATVEKMLPLVAGFLIAQLQQQARPALQRLVSDVPALAGAGGSPLPMPGDRLPRADAPDGKLPGATRTGSNGAGNRGPIDAGGPLPIPGDHIPGLGRRRAPPPDQEPDADPESPYDRLPDIIRRGGGPSVPGGGSLEDAIRSILGNLLGSNRGVIGTMIQLFLVRWLASFLRSILSRIFGGGR